jgi:hypothetical protein
MAGRRLTKPSLILECTMFHEVKIFDKKGMVKKVLSSKKLSSEYWSSFFNNPLSDAKKKGEMYGNKPQNNTDCDDENFG